MHGRRPRGGSEAEETVLLDENAEAEGHDYFAMGVFDISPDHRILAYAVDTNGSERHRLHFRDLETGTDRADEIEDVTYGFAWADDARTCFYVRLDDAMRPWQVWRHELGTAGRVTTSSCSKRTTTASTSSSTARGRVATP